jgi:hypothetical protein
LLVGLAGMSLPIPIAYGFIDETLNPLFLPAALTGIVGCVAAAVLLARIRKNAGRWIRVLAMLSFGCAFLAPLAAVAIPVCAVPFHGSNRMLNASNLKKLVIAMHNYHNDHEHLPAHAIYSKDGEPLLSWRVAILPYLGEEELFGQFHLDEPWDSPHNLALLRQMPKVYRRPWPYQEDDTRTHYHALVGPGAVFEGPKTLTFMQLTQADGMTKTILLADAAEAVPWTKPADLVFDPNGPLPCFGRLNRNTFTVGFADGSVRDYLHPDNAKRVRHLRALITWKGGEKVDLDDLTD